MSQEYKCRVRHLDDAHSYPSTQVKAGGLCSTASGPHRKFQTRLGYLRKTLTYKERREKGRE